MATSGVRFNQQVCRYLLVVLFFGSIVVLTPNGSFCVVPVLHSAGDMNINHTPTVTLWRQSH
jgi:hypothetical protein